MKKLLAVALLTLSSPGFAAYQRLYQGYRLPSVDAASFEKIINQEFLPLFPPAHALGLTAYRPALVPAQAGCSLPAEVSLLGFGSEKTYDAYKETEIGKRIRDAHARVFDPRLSRSLVPERWAGEAKTGHAYETAPDYHSFVAMDSALIVHCGLRVPEPALAAALKAASAPGPASRDIVFALEPDHLLEYVFFDRPETAQGAFEKRKKLLGPAYRSSILIPLEKTKIGSAPIHPIRAGQGVDARW